MTGRRQFLDRDSLTAVARSALGTSRRLERVERLAGGSKKGVYRLTCNDSTTVVLYVWDQVENYWPGAPRADPADPFADANGFELFIAANATLVQLGVRTPVVLRADATRSILPSDFAVVEDVAGGSLESLLEADPEVGAPALSALGDELSRLHGVRDDRIGKVARPVHSGPLTGPTCEQLVLERALGHLDDSASRVEAIGAVRGDLAQALRDMRTAIAPRREHGLIHGELGPDHVLIDGKGAPVLIDIEGLMFFDIEWEHAFLELRFDEHYRALHHPNLDEDRLQLYRLAQYLSLVAGPLRLLDGDFPDRDLMQGIADWNVTRVLTFAPGDLSSG